MAVQRWNREAVVQSIKDIWDGDGDVRHSSASEDHPKLLSAAIRYFGSWGDAVQAAGIDYASIRRKSQNARSAQAKRWSLESIAQAIRVLMDSGEQLTASAVREKHSALFSAAVSSRYYGSWRNAITSVGLDYDALLAKSRAECSNQRDSRGIRTTMRRMAALSESIDSLSEAQVQARYPGLYERALMHFPTWRSALQASTEFQNTARRTIGRRPSGQ